MKMRYTLLLLVLLVGCDEWSDRFKRINAIKDKNAAFAEIERLDRELAKQETADAYYHRANLIGIVDLRQPTFVNDRRRRLACSKHLI